MASASERQSQEARRIAMLKAMEAMQRDEGQFCANCASWESKFSRESKRSCAEIQQLRSAVQKMIDQLAAYMPGDSLREFVKVLSLDERLFAIPGELDIYRQTPFPVVDQVSRKELEQITAERDIAKMKLSVVTKELKDLQVANEALEQKQPAVDNSVLEQQSRLRSLEARLDDLEKTRPPRSFNQMSNEATPEPVVLARDRSNKHIALTAAEKLNERRRSHSASRYIGSETKSTDLQRIGSVENRVSALELAVDYGGNDLSNSFEGTSSSFTRALRSTGSRTTLPMKCFPGPGSPQKALPPLLSKGRSKLVLLQGSAPFTVPG